MYKYEDLKKVNSEISTTDIKGKDYAEVPQRIKAFRKLYPSGAIVTKLISNDLVDDKGTHIAIFRAEVYTDDMKLLGTGTAYEKENSTFINKTSYIENCETSAVGRALGMAGFGIDVSVASAEEVKNAMANQNKKTDKTKQQAVDDRAECKQAVLDLATAQGITAKKLAQIYKLNSKTTTERFKEVYQILKNQAKGDN